MEGENILMIGSKVMMKKLVFISIILIVLGIGVSILGFSLSGFNVEKYQSDHKRWYQVVTFPKN